MFRTLLTLGLVAYLTGSCQGVDIRLGNRALNYDSFRDEEANDEFSDRLFDVTSKTTKRSLTDRADDENKTFRKEHMHMGGPSLRDEEETSSERAEITTLKTPGDSPLNKTLSKNQSKNLQSLHIVIDATDDKEKQCKVCKRKKNKKKKNKKKSKKGKTGRRRINGKPCRVCEEPYFNPKWIKTEYTIYKDGEVKKSRRLPHVRAGEEIYIVLSGYTTNNKAVYEAEYFSNMTHAIQHYSPYATIIAGSIILNRDYVQYIDIQAAIELGTRLAWDINQSIISPKAELIMIGHDVGNVAVSTCASMVTRSIKAIFGLDQRILPHEFGPFYLRKDMAVIVQTLTTRPVRYNMGDRNFYPNGGCIPSKDPTCFACNSYKLLAADISKNGQAYIHQFCDTYEDYKANKCTAFPKVSIFNMERITVVPSGNYYTTIKDQVTKYLTSTATRSDSYASDSETEYAFGEGCDRSQLTSIVY